MSRETYLEYIRARAALGRIRAAAVPLARDRRPEAQRQLFELRREEREAEGRVAQARIGIYLEGGWPPPTP